ncbi:MAG: LacI family DNA-binding transcriptional regulator [Anaerolineae bacterium]
MSAHESVHGPMKRRVTIEDVARAAGVSRQTVSRAINAKGEISPLTYQRVMEAVQALDYRPSGVARSLATQRTRTIGLVVPDITNPFFPEVARGVQDVARQEGYSVFLCNTDESPDEELQVLQSLASRPVDGIILFGSRISEADLLAFADHYRPLVVLNRFLEHPGVSLVLVDNQRGAKLAVDYLAHLGHAAIGMLAGPVASPSSIQRVEGFRQAMAAHGLAAPEDWIVPGPPTIEGGYETARQILTQYPEVTAFFAYNDLSAWGAVQASRDLGRRVPAQCAVIGFDDIRLAAMVSPSLTSVRVDKYYLGQQAMIRLLAMLDTPDASFPPIHVGVELVVRESTLST